MIKLKKFQSIAKENVKEIYNFESQECYKVNLIISNKNLYIQQVNNQSFNHLLRKLTDEDNIVLRTAKKVILIWFEFISCGQYTLYCEMEDGENDYLLRGYADNELDAVISQIQYKEDLLIMNNIDYYGDIDSYKGKIV